MEKIEVQNCITTKLMESKMKEKTAVEWLVKIYLQKGVIDYFDIEQAKEMEKQQIIDANEDYSSNGLGEFLTGEQYYNETYGK